MLRPAAPARDDALRRLRRRLTLLCTALTGAVLLTVAIISLSLAEGQIRRGGEAVFQSNINAIVAKLQTDRVVSATWLAQTETAGRLILSISDGGTPLRFPGAWSPETDRGTLILRAAEGGRALGVDPDTPPLSAIETTATPAFPVLGDAGERYLAAVVLIPAERGWQSLVLLRDMSSVDGQILLFRWAFAALVACAIGALFLLCWVFAGRAIDPIAQSQRRQAEFVAAASHELRSPLAVIRTSASALVLSPGDAPRLALSIEQECSRMARLVDDLLCLARSDAGTWSLHMARVDLDSLLLETAEGFFPVARQKGQTLLLQVPDEALPPVLGDAERLRQILAVLLDNAFSYTPPGGTVTLSGRAAQGKVYLSVADTGPGVPPGDAERIFERFYRADQSRGGKGHFGLGLSIAAELSRLHGGSLHLADNGPGGATFELALDSGRFPH